MLVLSFIKFDEGINVLVVLYSFGVFVENLIKCRKIGLGLFINSSKFYDTLCTLKYTAWIYQFTKVIGKHSTCYDRSQLCIR